MNTGLGFLWMCLWYLGGNADHIRRGMDAAEARTSDERPLPPALPRWSRSPYVDIRISPESRSR